MKKNPWKTLSSKTVYKNQYITVVEDEVIKPDGKQGIYGFVKVRPTLGIVPIDENNNIYLCRQFRYIFKDESWEIPRGFIDDNENLERAAKRELNEEAGLTANKLTFIGSLRLSIGIMDEQCRVYLAQDLSKDKNFKLQEDEIDKVKKFTFSDVLEMINKGKILDGLTIASVFMIKDYLEI